MGLGEIRLGEMGLGEMGLGEMGQNPLYITPYFSFHVLRRFLTSGVSSCVLFRL